MLTLIHGDDSAPSRNYYIELKKNSPEPLTLDGASITLTDVQQALSGSDLFGTAKDIFIEDFLSKRKSQKELTDLTEIINDKSSIINIFLWESKELTKSQLNLLSKSAKIILYKIPATIFAFLDALRPDNSKQLLELFHKTLADKDPEFVLVMLQRQVRILLALCHSERSEESHSKNVISEITRLAPWQQGKLKKQAQQFSLEQLLSLHEKLFQLELGMKTGKLAQTLENEIDLLMTSI